MKENALLSQLLSVECIECKSVFRIVDVKRENMKKDGVSMWIMHYDCPNCGKKHYCQIDNAETMALFYRLKNVVKLIARARKNSKSVPKELQSKYEKLSKSLAEKRDALRKQYNGGLFLDESGNFVKVDFGNE